jgi:hypothetical protein
MRLERSSKTVARRLTVGLLALLLALAGTGLTIPGARPMDVAAQSDTTAVAPTGDAPAALNNRMYLPFVNKYYRRPRFSACKCTRPLTALKPPWIWQARPR